MLFASSLCFNTCRISEIILDIIRYPSHCITHYMAPYCIYTIIQTLFLISNPNKDWKEMQITRLRQSSAPVAQAVRSLVLINKECFMHVSTYSGSEIHLSYRPTRLCSSAAWSCRRRWRRSCARSRSGRGRWFASWLRAWRFRRSTRLRSHGWLRLGCNWRRGLATYRA